MTKDRIVRNFKDSNLPKGEIAIYKTRKGPQLEVKLQEETVWLSINQMVLLFDRDKSVISRHIKNVFNTGELKKDSTVAFFATVQKEGKRLITREIEYYNLDLIISVGYRVNSIQGTRFRTWATNVLRGYIIKGYQINEKRLLKQSEKLKELQNTISFLQEKSRHKLLEDQTQEILSLLNEYSKSISIFEQYDTNELALIKDKKPEFVLTYEGCVVIISQIKEELIAKKQASAFFAQEQDKKFESIVKNLYQTFGGKELYESTEEKAAHLLYLTIKDHPFVDGNKRTASLLFIYFLEKNNYLYKKNGERKINDPKFCNSKICPEGVARQNPMRILSASQGIPDFSQHYFVHAL